jgi:hypothetical protein
MHRRHALVVALLLGAAVVLGSIAALKTAELKNASAQPVVSSRAIARRNARLDRVQISLRKALARRPPKLPPVPHYPRYRRSRVSSGTCGRLRSSSYTTAPAETRSSTASTSTKEAAMTNHVLRLYTLAVSILVLFLVWVVVATHAWKTEHSAAADPRMRALALRERHVRHESIVVQRIVARRWHRYRIALTHRNQQIAAAKRQHTNALAAAASAPAPSVRIVSLPPLTVTRTS